MMPGKYGCQSMVGTMRRVLGKRPDAGFAVDDWKKWHYTGPIDLEEAQGVRWLEGQSGISRVIYPGLESHPQHELAKTQFNGFSGMLAFEVKGGWQEAKIVMENLQTILSDTQYIFYYRRRLDDIYFCFTCVLDIT